MEYRPSELAEELDFGVNQIYRVYIQLGCPHRRDGNQHIWINGAEFRGWVLGLYKKLELGPEQAWCLVCRGPVPLVDPKWRRVGKFDYHLSLCPVCGTKVARFVSGKKRR